MPSIDNIKPTAKFVVFTNTQEYSPPYDRHDSGGYETEDALNLFLHTRTSELNSMKIYRLTPVNVSVKLELKIQ